MGDAAIQMLWFQGLVLNIDLFLQMHVLLELFDLPR